MKNQLILGDNLDVLKSIPSDSIDLIYIDPPFFSNRHYEVIWGDEGEIASFNDRWSGGINHYIGWLYERVEELHRLLKPTGSFYLHCDWHANAYIRVMILDKIFGSKNFVNEIVWCYSGPFNSNIKRFPNKHDVIFLYSKGGIAVFNKNDIRIPYKSGIHHSKHATVASFKGGHVFSFSEAKERENLGKIPEDWWSDIYTVDRVRKERIGYPTQKPEALLERIIKASSKPGDIVLDAFCGGGTTIAVARRLGRKFIGIDQSVRAIAVSRARLENQTDLLINDIYEVRTEKYDYDNLRNMDPFKFETFIVEQFGGIPNIKQCGDGGQDGIKKQNGVSIPIQVKQQTGVGRPQIQSFIGYLVQKKVKRGFFIAFDFSKTAYEYVAEIKQNNSIEVELVKVEDIIEVSKKPKISLDWTYKTLGKKQQVTFTATCKDVNMWQWDWDYDEKKGFAAEILSDYKGVQIKKFEAGCYEIAVRATDKDGLESIKTIKLFVNGGVHTE